MKKVKFQGRASPTRLHYEVRGTRGPKVVFVMGLGMQGLAWAPQRDMLERDCQTLIYDHPGIGQSRRGGQHLRLEDHADDLASLLRTLGWTDCHIVGVSMGGMVAQVLAGRHTDLVRSVCLVATSFGGWKMGAAIAPNASLLVGCFVGKPRARARATLRMLFPDEFLDNGGKRQLKSTLYPVLGPPPAVLEVMRQTVAATRFDGRRYRPMLKDIAVTVVKPSLDALIPASESDRLARAIPNARLVDFPASGHGIGWQNPVGLSELIINHVEFAEAREASFIRFAS